MFMSTTFKSTAYTYQEARRAHAMVERSVNEFVESGNEETTPADVWSALVGSDVSGIVGEAIKWTVPAEIIPLLHRSDSLPAAFAFGSMLDALDCVDVSNDLQVRQAIRQGWKSFEERRLQANHVEEGFGQDESMSWHTLRDIVEGAGGESIRDKMMWIAQLAGRMFDALEYSRKRVESEDPQEIKSTTIGGDVPRLLPSELAKMSNGRTADVTSMKVLKKQAQQFRMKGERSKSRGPLVIALDESGSMHDAVVGARGRNCWAKACAIALTRVAWNENRPVRVVHFAQGCVVQDIPRDDHDALWEMARSFLSGGTDFTSAFEKSREVVGDLESQGFKGADIVLVSDGVDRNHEGHDREIDRMDEDGVQLWTVAIGESIGPTAPVRARAEKYVFANDENLGDEELAGELARDLKRAALAKPERGLN